MFETFLAVILAHAFMGVVALCLAIMGWGIASIVNFIVAKRQLKKLKETKKISKTT